MKRPVYPDDVYIPQLLAAALLLLVAAAPAQENQKVKFSGRTVVAEVVALDQPFMVNRLGSSVPTGQIFALRTDVMPSDNNLDPLPSFDREQDLSSYVGRVTLKQYKRPRPIVLRVNVGDILEIRFCNLLSGAKPTNRIPEYAGFHIMGMNLLSGPGEAPGTSSPPPLSSDSSYVGRNVNSFAKKGSIKVYRYFAAAEGTFIISSAAQPNQTLEIGNGLFGCAVVEPPQAEYYRSQVTRSDLFYSTYYSTRLPANMLLHVRPGTTDHWILTTYKTRLQREALKNIDVTIRNATSELLTEKHPNQENNQNQFYELDRATGKFNLLVLSPEEQLKKRSDMEAGKIVPPGYLYSAPFETEHGENEDAHPIIDYSTVYDTGGQDESGVARTGGSPILRMIYPVAKSLLAAQTENDGLKIETGAKSYQLPADPSESPDKIQDRYKAEITELDAGSLPRNLVPVLNAWGIQEIPDLTKVTPERSYISEISDVTPKLNYIWLLTGVTVNGEQNDSVLIQGDIVEGKPQLTFLKTELQLRHSDPTAIITGPQAGRFPYSQNSPSFYEVPALPDRRQPFREFVLGYHNFSSVAQAFPQENSPSPIASVLTNGNDFLAINYGIAGIATEILANRLGVGPEGINGDEVDLKFEEFFLSSWAVGDPAMLVDRPANTPAANGKPGTDPPEKGRATRVYYPDDPSNVYHSYMRDHVIMRIYNAGPGAPHVHHLHAHQWLRSPNSDNSQYLDSELIVPGSAFSLDMVYNGSGNRNQTVGDSIFHCHFYPHFARGMWALWRVHDVFEEGTLLDPKTGAVKVSDPLNPDPKVAWVRALPDAEIQTGTPIPAIVPLPALGTAPFPARVRVTSVPKIKDPAGKNPDELKKWVNVTGSSARMVQVRNEYVYERDSSTGKVVRDENGEPIEKKGDNGQFILFKDINGMPVVKNPGYPFFVPGVAGHRPPHPPLAMAWEEDQPGVPVLKDNKKVYLDGGLPRHQVLGGQTVREFHTRWDFTKDFIRYKNDDHLNQSADNAVDGALVAYLLPEDGTPIERAAMKAHATRSHETVQPDGSAGNFILNGLPPTNGAPYADPGVDDNGNAARDLRKYKAAAVQKDVVLNKLGWHYPQERFLTLWQDVKPTFDEKRPPQPFFFRANGGETVEFWHTNLVPDYYQLDDFQVRTPTDIIGQHIHLVKFDVTSSDGAANGFNYEDGVFSPDEVRGRIFAITRPWAEESYKKLSQEEQSARKYDLFAFNNATDGVAAIDWSEWARKTQPLEPVPWDKSYMQWQMTQGQPKPDPSEPLPPNKYLEPPTGQNWDGAMTTIMRFSTDPLLNNEGQDRTVRTVFTHDHFGPSTHQQTGLYGGLLVEPTNSTWIDPVTGSPYYDTVNRSDGGPTGWEAIIQMPDRAESYREFALELQDLQLAYVNTSRPEAGPIWDGKNNNNPSGNPPLFSFKDGFNDGPIEPNSVLYANFSNNGITLSDTVGYPAKVEKTGDDQWVVKDPIKYAYGPNGEEAAFYIVKKVANYDVFTPNLTTWSDPTHAINAPAPAASPSPTPPKPVPQLVSSGGGTYSFNYRNEPLNNTIVAPSPSPYTGRVEGTEDAADFSYAFASIKRDKPWNEVKPPESPVTGKVPPPLFNRPEDPAKVNEKWCDPVGFAVGGDGVNDGKVSSYDPYTPLLRAYQNDRVQIRVLAGAHVAPHSFMAHGVKWLFEPSSTNSGYRNVQGLGLSEHFELIFRLPPATTPHSEADSKNSYSFADYLYAPSSDTAGLSLGVWGIIRSYDPPGLPRDPSKPEMPPIASLYRLPKAANPRPFPDSGRSPTSFRYPDIPDVEFIIRAKESPITYNDGKYKGAGPIQNQNGIVFVLDEVKERNKPLGVKTNPGDPLILRVRAGDWIKITLQNDIPTTYKPASATVGVHPQLLAYDVTRSDGANIGFNPVQTLKGTTSSTTQPEKLEYWWYAGDFQTDENGNIKLKKDEAGNSLGIPLGRPREMGAINLVPPDSLNQHVNGLIGALVVEPANSTWDSKEYVGASAAIKDKDSRAKLLFREFVLIHQNDVNASYVPKGQTSPTSVKYALDNKSEDLGYRLGLTASPTPSPAPTFDLFSNELIDGKDPKTPVFEATAGEHVRFRVVFPGGAGGGLSQPTFEIHGHSWQEEPYGDNSLELGNNVKSQVLGAQIIAPNQSLNILIDSAGGPKNLPGDYLFCDYMRTANGSSGAWGILRVIPLKGAE